MRAHLKLSGTSYRIDETYVKVGTEWKYLYRAVDSAGDTIEFLLSAKRDVSAAKRFFRKLMKADHRRLSFAIGTDKHASYPEAFAASVGEKVLPADCKLRRVKYLNNVIEQDHRFIRRRWRAMPCFRSFHTAERTLEGVEAYGENEKAMRKEMISSAVEMLKSADPAWIGEVDNPPVPGSIIHEMGTARMGNDPKTSVLNKFNQCHDAPNVFVTDGACMPSSATQNPSLTYMALTARACDYAVKQLKSGELN